MSFAPCGEVGGKRFSFLSKYLAERCESYVVVARTERENYVDSTAFRGNVVRTPMFPYWPPERRGFFRKILARAWSRSLCTIDKYVGWVLPAIKAGKDICRESKFNIVTVTVPQFSAVIAAAVLARRCKAKLVIDYRDEWTNFRSRYPWPFGRFVAPWLERAVLRRSDAVVLCTDIMRSDLLSAFGDLVPDEVEVIYNGFDGYRTLPDVRKNDARMEMVYAGTFHGNRRLSTIANSLADLLKDGLINKECFRFRIYSELDCKDIELIDELGLGDIVKVCGRVPYDEILRIMHGSDILFLPSGDEVPYAVPFKFFDYLSVRRPILAVASPRSTVGQLMAQVDCGEFADIGDRDAITKALRCLIVREKHYTFAGGEDYLWENAANEYLGLFNRLLAPKDHD